MYNGKVGSTLKVKQTFFRNIFCTSFNIGFGSPRTDVCSTCLAYDEKIKQASDETSKSELIAEKQIYTREAKNFCDHLKESRSNMITFSYDCEKNLPLPKSADQIVYYKRQLYLYNFTVVQGSSNARLTSDNVRSYLW